MATSLFIAKFIPDVKKKIKLFIPLLVLQSLHTRKIILFYKITYFYRAQEKKGHEFLFVAANASSQYVYPVTSPHQLVISQDQKKQVMDFLV